MSTGGGSEGDTRPPYYPPTPPIGGRHRAPRNGGWVLLGGLRDLWRVLPQGETGARVLLRDAVTRTALASGREAVKWQSSSSRAVE